MDTRVFIDTLNQTLGKPVEQDENGAYAFILDGVPVLLRYRAADASFLLHMELGYPTAMGGGVCAKLLGANFLLAETMGAAISLDERTGMAFLEHLVPVAGLDGAGFVARVEGFVALADVWTRRIKDWNEEREAQVDGRLDVLQRSLDGLEEEEFSPETPAAMLRV